MPNGENQSSCEIIVLISGGGSNLQSIIDHIEQNHIKANIACVISNKPDVYGLIRAHNANIPTHVIDHSKHETREAFEAELINTIAVYNSKLILLAGFMRILSPTFIKGYQGDILNIHPSLLPKYTGLHTHTRALDAGDTEHGCSVHFVTPTLDQGPLIIQADVKVKNSDTPDVLAARVLKKEHVIYPLAVKWYCEKRLAFKQGKTHLDGKPLEHAVMLTQAHEAQLN